METLKVRDLMTTDVIAVRADEDLATLNDLMFENHIRHLPVVDREKNILGLVSHRDLLGTALYSGDSLPVTELQELLRTMRVREIMVRGIETASPDDDIEDVGRTMLESKFGCLPVTEGGQLVGILTEADFIRYLVEWQTELKTQGQAKKSTRISARH